MQHAIVFNYFESGTQASKVLVMSQFHKISVTKCIHRQLTLTRLDVPGSDRPNTLNH